MRRSVFRRLSILSIAALFGFTVIRALVHGGSIPSDLEPPTKISLQGPRAALTRAEVQRLSGEPARQDDLETDSRASQAIPDRPQSGAVDLPQDVSDDSVARDNVTTSSDLAFDPVAAARSADLLLNELSTDSSEQRNYSAVVGQLLSNLGYLSPISGSRRTAADTELPRATLHERYCENVAGRESEGLTAVRLVSGIIPKGLVLNQTSGSLCGEPSETGIFRFALELQYGSGDPNRKTFRLVVNEGPREETEGELRLITAQLETGQLGAEYVFQLEAEGGKLPYAWSIVGLPEDLELDSATGLIAGTPKDSGEFPIDTQVRDAEGKVASLSLSLLIRETPVFITTHEVEEGTVKQPYQARFEAQGGLPPYRWELVDSSLPDGLALSPLTGVLDGTPAGAFEALLRIRVTDGDQKSDTADIPLLVRASSLRVVTQALADGFEGSAYQFTLAAEGGTPPYHWSSPSVLPTGLALSTSGALRGTPALPGEFAVNTTVSDSKAQEANRIVRIRIQAAEPVPEETPEVEPSPEPSGEIPGGPTEPVIELPGVTGLQAVPSDNKVGIVWTNPIHGAFLRTVVVRGEGAAPQSETEGEVIYSGSGNTALDLTALNDHTYIYAAFAGYEAGTKGTVIPSEAASATPHTPDLSTKPDPFIDQVIAFKPLDRNCFGCTSMPNTVLGQPHGSGESQGNSVDVVSIGARVNDDNGASAPYGGSITVAFSDNIIFNGTGADFTIFENAFRLAGTDDYFVEPATVEVSADGEHYYRFPFDFVPHYNADGALNLFNPFCYASGFAGVKPVYANPNVAGAPAATNPVRSGGDQFDLSDLPGAPLSWARFVRITSTGDRWVTDMNGDLIRHSNSSPTFGASGRGNSGFDLDAVTAVNF